MSKPNVTVDLSKIEKRYSKDSLKAKQAAFAQRVAFDMREHVPVDEGTLRDSEPLSSDYASGKIIWNTPYAKDRYNADSVRTVKNAKASPHWAEVTKAEKLDSWKKMAAGLLGDDRVTIGGSE